MMNYKKIFLTIEIWSWLIALAMLPFFILSNYLHYGAEGILYNGLLRLLHGQSFSSTYNELPLALTTYFPTFYALFYPFLKLFKVDSIQNIAYFTRPLSVLWIGFIYYFIFKQAKYVSNNKINIHFLLLAGAFFILKEFVGILCFKPDTYAILLEVLALFLGLNYLKNKKRSSLLQSSFFFALAFLFKLNVIGMGIGFGLSLIFEKRYKAFFIFTLLGLCIATAGLSAIYFYLGDPVFRSIIQTTKSDIIPMKFTYSIVQKILLHVIFPYLIIFAVGSMHMFNNKIFNKGQKTALLFATLISFFIALIGQYKYGAAINYFYNIIFLYIILGAISYEYLDHYKNAISHMLRFLIISILFLTLMFPVQIIINDYKNYDYVKLNTFLDKNFPDGKIYTENNNAAIHLESRALLGSGFFSFFKATQRLREHAPTILKNISQNGGVDAIVAVGKNCHSFTPNSDFSPILSEFNKLVYKERKICVFGKK